MGSNSKIGYVHDNSNCSGGNLSVVVDCEATLQNTENHQGG
jgi:hypothetical protein